MTADRSPWAGAALVTLCLIVAVLFLGGLWFIDSLNLEPDRISVDPLEEITDGLQVVEEPTQRCPDSAGSCFWSVMLASGGSAEQTAARIAANAEAVGFVEVDDHFRPWAATRGCSHLSLYGPRENGFHQVADIPPDAKTVTLGEDCPE